jgi:hypothetical protein
VLDSFDMRFMNERARRILSDSHAGPEDRASLAAALEGNLAASMSSRRMKMRMRIRRRVMRARRAVDPRRTSYRRCCSVPHATFCYPAVALSRAPGAPRSFGCSLQ